MLSNFVCRSASRFRSEIIEVVFCRPERTSATLEGDMSESSQVGEFNSTVIHFEIRTEIFWMFSTCDFRGV